MLTPVSACSPFSPQPRAEACALLVFGVHRVLHTLAPTYLLSIGADAADEEGLSLAQRLQQLVKRCLQEGMHVELLTRCEAQLGGPAHHCCMEPTKGSAAPAVGVPMAKDHTAAISQEQ